MEEIKPLPFIKVPGARGRPSQWHDGIPHEYVNLLNAGYSHEDILCGWDITNSTFKNWTHRSRILKEASGKAIECADEGKEPALLADMTDDERKEAMLTELAAIALNRTYKPNERITAMREWFDRNYGKPLQTTQVNQQTTYTIIAAIPAPPNSLGLQAPPLVREAHAIEDIIEDDSIYS